MEELKRGLAILEWKTYTRSIPSLAIKQVKWVKVNQDECPAFEYEFNGFRFDPDCAIFVSPFRGSALRW